MYDLIAVLIALFIVLNPDTYRILFDKGLDEVHLIIWSDSSPDDPWYQVESIEVAETQTSAAIQRHPLPPGSYVIQAESFRWEGCPKNCQLVIVETSPTKIIHVPGRKPEDESQQ